ncbi:MAG: hypothetical protein LH632_15280, partial [Rhodoferax sp.]|nr:hypothetical protein [Rhodoferax sp.]
MSTYFTTRAAAGIVSEKLRGCQSPCGIGVGTHLHNSGDWRRDPESNRAARICNPVHNRFA